MTTHPQINRDTLGADLRALRKMRGLTLADLAGRLGRSVGWMSQVERDLSVPSITELRHVASILEVPTSLFFGQADAPADEAVYGAGAVAVVMVARRLNRPVLDAAGS